METPLISVLLPVYKHEAYLMDAVLSIINQTYKKWELIILSDDPNLKLKVYEQIDKRIRVYDTHVHLGKWSSINTGMRVCRGQYIAMQDADDMSIPQRLKLSLKYIDDCDLVYGDAICLLPDGKNTYLTPGSGKIDIIPIGNQGSYFLRLTDKVPKYPEYNRGDDWIWTAKCLQAGMRMKYLPMPLYYYRDYTGNFRASSNKIKRWFSNRKLRKLVAEITKS